MATAVEGAGSGGLLAHGEVNNSEQVASGRELLQWREEQGGTFRDGKLTRCVIYSIDTLSFIVQFNTKGVLEMT